MRIAPSLPAVALALALALSGCLGAAGEPGATPSPAPATPPPAAPRTPAPAPPSPDADAEAEARAVEVVNETFDFGTGEAAGPEGKAVTFVVPEGFARLALDASILKKEVGGQGPSLALNQRVLVLDPEGNEVLSLGEAGASERAEAPATPGEWTIRYEGAANAEARVSGVAHA